MSNINNSNNNTIISGTSSADSITNTGSNVTISPGYGNDTINLNGSNQVILNGNGNYHIYGLTSNDTIFSSDYQGWDYYAANRYLSFAKDNAVNIGNYIAYDAVNKKINLASSTSPIPSLTTAYFSFGKSGQVVNGASDIDLLINGSGNATINANGSNVYNFAAPVLINGTSSGESFTNFTDYYVTINAGAGDDSISNSEGWEVSIVGGEGNDYIHNSYGARSTIDAGAGNDTIYNSGGSVTINAGAGNDSVYNSGSNVTIDAGAGNDVITNTGAQTTIFGGDGDDSIYNDYYYDASMSAVNGGTGDDYISNNTSNATLVGGAGNDIIALNSRSSLTTIDYANGDGNDTIIGLDADDTLKITSDATASVNGADVSFKVGTGSILLKNMAGREINLVDAEGNAVETIIGNIIEGTAGNDKLNNSQNDVIIRPLAGDDVVSLKGARQIIDYTGGKDTIYGLDPDDRIRLNPARGGWTVSVKGSDVIYTNVHYEQNEDADNPKNAYTRIVDGTLTIKDAAKKKIDVRSYDGSTFYVPAVGASLGNDNGVRYIENYFNGVLIDAGNGDKSIYTTGDKVTIRAEGENYIDGYGKNVSVKTGDGDDQIGFHNEDTVIVENLTVDAGGGNNGIELYGGAEINGSIQSGKNIKVKTGGGSDNISVYHAGSVSVDAGDGTNYVDIQSEGADISDITINGGAGHDEINVHVADNVIVNAGAGNNYIGVNEQENNEKHQNATVKAGNGNDNISVICTDKVSIEAGDGNNAIDLRADSNVTVNAGKGDDNITADGTKNMILNIGDGNNTVTAEGGWSYNETLDTDEFVFIDNFKVNAGAGNDSLVVLHADNVSIDAGAGNNVVSLGSNEQSYEENISKNATVKTGAGADTISVRYIDNVRLELGDGSDVINIRNANNLYLDAGDGNNVISLSMYYEDDDVDPTLNNFTLKGGKGNDRIDLDIPIKNLSIELGDGNDTIEHYYYASDGVSIVGGAGNKEIRLAADNVSIKTGAGNDSVRYYGSKATLDLGDGNNNIEFSDDEFISTRNVSVKTGTGADTITANGDSSTVDSGAGNDRIIVEYSNKVVVNAGAGNDSINGGVYDNSMALTVDGGAGNDTIFSAAVSSSVVGGDGNDSIILSSGGEYSTELYTFATVNAGKGSDTVENIWCGPFVYQYADGDGNDLILGDGMPIIQLTSGSVSSVSYANKKYLVKVGSGTITVANEGSYTLPLVIKDIDSNLTAWYVDDSNQLISLTGGTYDNENSPLTNFDSNVKLDGNSRLVNYGSNVTVNNNGGEVQNIFGANVVINGAERLYNAGSKATLNATERVLNEGNNVVINCSSSVANTGSNVTIRGAGEIRLGGSNEVLVFTSASGNAEVYGFDETDEIRIDGDYSIGADTSIYVEILVGGKSIYLYDADVEKLNIYDIDYVATADTLTSGIEYNTKTPSKLIVKDPFSGVVDAAKISDRITLIDATASTKPTVLKGGAKSNVINAGAGDSTLIGGAKDDKFYGGMGENTFVYTVGNGKDVVYDYEARDIVSIDGATLDKLIFTDKKDAVTITLNGDTKSQLTVNKNDTAAPLSIKVGGEEFVYGSIPSGASFDKNKTKLTIDDKTTVEDGATIDAKLIASTIKEIDASAYKGALNLVGNDNANVIRAGEGGSTLYGGHSTKAVADKLYGGSGADVFVYASGDGADVIGNFDGSKGDYVSLDGATSISAAWSSDKLTVTIDKQKLTFDDPQGEVKFIDADGKVQFSTGINLPSGVGYNAKKTAVTVASAAEVDAIDLTSGYNSLVKEVDASKYKGAINIVGNDNANVIRAGEGGSTLYGGHSTKAVADKLYGGAGADVFVYASGDGADVIGKFDGSKGDYVSLVGATSISAAWSSDKLTVTIDKQKLTFDDPQGEVKFINADGKVQFSTGINLPSGVGYNAKKTAVTVASAAEVDVIDLTSGYNSLVKEVDASKYKGAINIVGNANANVIRAGEGNATLNGGYDTAKKKVTADKLYGSTTTGASDVFVWDAIWGGGDQIYNYSADAGDVISITGGDSTLTVDSSDFKISGNKVVMSAGTGKLTINDLTSSKTVKVLYGDDKEFVYASLPSGVTYDDKTKNKAMKIAGDFEGTLDVTTEDYLGTVVTLDASGSSNAIELIGNKKAKVFIGGTNETTMVGSAAADVFNCGGGSDVIAYSVGGGKDQIYNFDSSTDVIRLFGATVAATDFTEKGKDITLTIDKGSITLKDAPRGVINVVNGDGSTVAYKTLPTGITYNAKKELVTATKDFKGTLNAGDLGVPVKEINAAATTDAVTLQGAASTATKITAGKGGSSILGGTGADTMIGGKGVDIFAAGNGADLITNYTAGQDKIQIVGALTAGKVNGSNVELTTSKGSITLKGVVGKELTVNVDGADAKYKFTKTDNTLDKALVGGSAAELAADVDNYWFTRSDGAADEIGALLDMTATADETALALKSFDLDSSSMYKTLPTLINVPRKQKTLR